MPICGTHGLLRPSFIPPLAQRQLRDLTRYRSTLVAKRARLVNRLHKLLEDTNLKLTAVVTDVNDVSARAMLGDLLAGETDPATIALLARGQLRKKCEQLTQALEGRLQAHHRFLLATQLAHLGTSEHTQVPLGHISTFRFVIAMTTELLRM